jgi:hypothetical protein
MALIKQLPDPYGTGTIDAYVRWAGLYVEPIARTIRAVFNVYRDRAAREAGKEPVDQIAYALTGEGYDAFTQGQAGAADSIGALVYGFARAQPDLSGAEDA